MAYQFFPNIILLLSILGVFVLVLRRLPEATSLDNREAEAHAEPARLLEAKGLPALVASRGKAVAVVAVRRVWHFMLEAKGLRQGPAINYKIKKIWRREPQADTAVRQPDEDYYLEQIKKAPRDLERYNKLGQFYLDRENYEEARNVYDYLVKHSPASHDYLAKLGYCNLKLGRHDQAVESYGKSLALDSSHPNRYYNLALAQTALGDSAAAAAALEKALVLDSNNIKYQTALTEAKRKVSGQ